MPHDTGKVWEITELEPPLDHLAESETVFALGNGYFGVRGVFEESRCVMQRGVYINGFFETEAINYAEKAYGLAKNYQKLLNVPNGTPIELYVNDEQFDLGTGTCERYLRRLDMRWGYLQRLVHWRSPSGVGVQLATWRLVSLTHLQMTACWWRLTLDRDCTVDIVSRLLGGDQPSIAYDDPRIGAELKRRPLTLQRRRSGANWGELRYKTRNSDLTVSATMTNQIYTECRKVFNIQEGPHEIAHRFQIRARKNEHIRLIKHLYYSATRFGSARPPRPRFTHGMPVKSPSVADLFKEQREYLTRFWESSDVRIEGDLELQQGIRYSIFQLLQATGSDGYTSIGAKGLTGTGYDGHYFWDTEIYALPFYIYTSPDIARNLLRYRYYTLPQARERARELHMRGALYPWRTINGQEASAFFPAGTAQYHINADILFAVRKYLLATGDIEFLLDYGAEMYIETARIWLALGTHIPNKGFCINMVTGPDEYTALVDNNVYTNMMASDNLRYAAEAVAFVRGNHPEAYNRLCSVTGLAEGEADEWLKAAEAIFIPYDKKRHLYPQDEGFLERAPWDFAATPAERYPLLLHYHPLTLYRYQVLKQPDLVLALFLQGDKFSDEEKRRNFDYYDKITTGDSSLAPCIQCIMAAEFGRDELAYKYYRKTARMDLDNINGNVRDGLHVAAMAGNWMSLVYGFAGMRDYHGKITFRPRLPKAWRMLSFRLHIRGSLLEVEMHSDSTIYTLLRGSPLTIEHNCVPLQLNTPGAAIKQTHG